MSRIGFPIGTRADELPKPNVGGTLPAGGEFGYGLTTFDADFDGFPDAVTVHTEQTIAQHLNDTWQANRPSVPGFPPPPIPGPALDFDGDGSADDLDEDCIPLNGNEMVVFAVESITLSTDPATGLPDSAMLLDHMLTLENVTPDASAQFRFYFTGGTIANARPEAVRGVTTLNIGDAALVDRFQDSVTIVEPGEVNLGVDGAWFAFVEDVAESSEQVVVTIGRALGASHSAIDDGNFGHDLEPGDPWYLKRFYVDGHEYNVVSLMTQTPAGADPSDSAECNTDFAFITIRTPVPKGNFFNPQDSLFQQGYFLDGLPPEMSVLPPFNVEHTIFEDIERIDAGLFNDVDFFGPCSGDIAPADPLQEIIRAEEPEPRLGTELRETYTVTDTETAWQTHQTLTAPTGYTTVDVPEGQIYLLTLPWRAPGSRIAFYGCTRGEPGPFDEDNPPPLDHDALQTIAECWRLGIIPPVDEGNAPFTGELVEGDLGDLPPRGSSGGPVADADLRVEKAAEVTTPAAGTQVSFALETFNDGPGDASSYVVIDILPDGLSYVSDTAGDVGGSCEAGTPPLVLCTFGLLTAGNSEVFEITANIDAGIPPGTMLENTVSVVLLGGGTTLLDVDEPGPWASGRAGAQARVAAIRAGGEDPNPTNDEAAASIIVTGVSDLSLVGVGSPDPVIAGERLVQTLTVRNAGPSDAADVRLVDPLPEGTTFVSAVGAACGGVAPGEHGVLSCSIGRLRVGESTEVTVVVDVLTSLPPNTELVRSASVDARGTSDPVPLDNVGGGTVSSTAMADLGVVRNGPSNVTPGQSFEWLITLTNDGPSDATGVYIEQTLPDGAHFVTGVGGTCALVRDGVVGCDVGSVPAGGEVVVRVRVNVDENAPDGISLDAPTSVRSDTPERDRSDDVAPSDPESALVARAVDLSLVKEALGPAIAGGRLEYRLTVFNAGPSVATGVEIIDTLPAGTVLSDGAVGCTEVGADVRCEVPDVAPGGSGSITLSVDVDDSLAPGTVLRNTARARSDEPDANLDNDQGSAEALVTLQADVSASVLAPEDVVAGEEAALSIELANAGPSAARSVEAIISTVDGTNLATSDARCVQLSGGGLRCSLGSMAPGAAMVIDAVLQVQADVPDGESALVTVHVDSGDEDLDPTNDNDAAAILVASHADLRLVKTAETPEVLAGEGLDFTLEVVNLGPSTARGVMIEDVPSGGMTLTGGDVCTVSGADGLARCAMGALEPGQSASISLSALVATDVPDGARLENVATVRSQVHDPDLGGARAVAAITARANADVRVELLAPEHVEPGAVFSYVIDVENAGPSVSRDVSVQVDLPERASFVSSTLERCTEAAGALICDVGDMMAGHAERFEVSMRSDVSAAEGDMLDATMIVSAETSDRSAGNNTADAATRVTFRDGADLSIEKTALNLNPAAGGTLTYRLRVSNEGPRSAPGVTLEDILPGGMMYLSADGAVCEVDGAGTVQCFLGELRAGAVTDVLLSVELDAGLPAGTIMSNAASIASLRADPDAGNDRSQTTVVMSRRADLVVGLSAGAEPIIAGERVTFDARVTNEGPSSAEGAFLTFSIPEGTTYISDSAGCDRHAMPTLVCGLGELDRDGFSGVFVTVEIDADQEGSIPLARASVSSETDDAQLENDQASLLFDVGGQADLRFEKTVSAEAPAPGDEISYALRLTNRGPSEARAVTLVDSLPEGLAYLADTLGCDVESLSNVQCSLGRIAAGETVDVLVSAIVGSDLSEGTSIINSASVDSSTSDPDPDDNTASATIDVSAEIDLDLAVELRGDVVRDGSPPWLEAMGGAVTAGERLTATLKAGNRGRTTATDVRIEIQIPEGAVLSDGVSAACEPSSRTVVTCSLRALVAGGVVEIPLPLDVAPHVALGTSVIVQATIRASESDADPDDNVSSGIARVDTASDLSVAVLAERDSVPVGEPVAITVSVANDGPSTAPNSQLEVALPAGAIVDDTPSSCSIVGASVICGLGAMAPGAERDLEFSARMMTPDMERALSVIANIHSGNRDPDPSDNTEEVVLTVRPAIDMSLSLAAVGERMAAGDPPLIETTADQVAAGRSVTLTLRAENRGEADASGVVVVIAPPSGVTLAGPAEACRDMAPSGIRCAIGDVPPGGRSDIDVRFDVAADVGAGTILGFEAAVEANELDEDNTNDTVMATFTTLAQADLALVANAAPSLLTPGGMTSLRFTTANAGPSVAVGAAVRYELSAAFSLVTMDDRCRAEDGVLTCDVGDLQPGETVGHHVVLRAKPSAFGRRSLGAAWAESRAEDPRASNDVVVEHVEILEPDEVLPPRHRPVLHLPFVSSSR